MVVLSKYVTWRDGNWSFFVDGIAMKGTAIIKLSLGTEYGIYKTRYQYMVSFSYSVASAYSTQELVL